MSSYAASELPEEFRQTLTDPVKQDSEHDEPQVLAEDQPRQPELAGNAWLLLGILLLVAVGVLMLLIFASGGNADSSMML
ncbi:MULTISPECIES: hypothetical protein [Glycomyces]|uniref:Uncharacterized protein n=1 Tax=Glycomyces artemisiae TaxID=1076443 RepID=A0A2T0UVM8_9ACTN|nr:hypothetical protein [Glycomyces artemisiae]NUQ88571.1 hypothetical protein [Glycomyces artemisiae]PRY61989.1 hypothetical protein B0I28_101315 [Glycomyces artemisiae]